MKKPIGLVMLSAAALAGCASHEHHMQRLGERLQSAPLVTVRLGIVSVSPEPIVVDLRDPKPIAWQAPAGFSFRGKGIEILGLIVDADNRPIAPDPNESKKPNLRLLAEGQRAAFECKTTEREVICVPVAGVVQRGVYRYAIRLQDKDQKPLDGDPYIIPN